MSDVDYRPVRLPMYDWPEVKTETQALEVLLTDELCSALQIAPSSLEPWPVDTPVYNICTDPGLLLSQTCGYPLTHALHGKVCLLGAPHYDVVGCEGPRYRSHIVVARNSDLNELSQLRGARAAFNTSDSQSGMNALRHMVAPLSERGVFFGKVINSGGHLASMQAVADGHADVAAIDAVCWALACQELPELAQRLRSIAVSEMVPSLPYITSQRHDDKTREKILSTVSAVLSAPGTQKSRQRLHICGFSKLDVEDYAPILSMENEAETKGYPVLG